MNILQVEHYLHNLILEPIILLPKVNIELDYEEVDTDVGFHYKHESRLLSRAPFTVSVTNIGDIEEIDNKNALIYTCLIYTPKPIRLFFYQDTMSALVDYHTVLYDYSKSENTSSVIATFEGPSPLFQWVYNCYQVSQYIRLKTEYDAEAKQYAVHEKQLHLKQKHSLQM
jgi:hypothetical protein